MSAERSATGGGAAAAGLYVHVPFCLTRCVYCDFATEAREAVPEGYVGAVLREAELYGERKDDLWRSSFSSFDTLYLGGGTPSLLPPKAWAELMSGLGERLPLGGLCEVTVEANPDDVQPRLLDAMAAAGVTRVSLGVQSLRQEDLLWLGRRHSAEQVVTAAREIRARGLSLALDLMYGLPRASPAAWREVLLRAIELEPMHISCYELTVEAGTPLGARGRAGEIVCVEEERLMELFLMARNVLGSAGYEQYEVSNYARGPASRSRHNQKYWDHQPYLGLGPAAHSFAMRRRWWNHRRYEDYLGALSVCGLGVESCEHLDHAQLRLERLMLGFRRSEGLPVSFLSALRGGALSLSRLVAEGLLDVSCDRAAPTAQGLLLSNQLPLRFSERPSRGW